MKNYFAAAAVTLLLAPGAAFAQDAGAEPAVARDFAGPRIEGRIGYETPTVSDDGDVYKIGSAVSFGGELGFDVRAGNKVVVGPYVNYELSSVKLCDAGDCLKEKGNLSVGGRLGVIVGDNTLVYGKLGYASIKFKAEVAGLTGTDSQGGIHGGLGVELGIGQNAYGFLEASYADYGKFFGINLQRRHVAGGIGVRF